MRYFLTIKCRLNLHTAYKKRNELSNWWGEKCFMWIKSQHTSVKRVIKKRKTVFLCFFHIIGSQMCWSSADNVTYMHLTGAAKPLWSFSSQLNIQSSPINFSDLSKTRQELVTKRWATPDRWILPTAQTLKRFDFFEDVFKDDCQWLMIAVGNSYLSR